LTDTDKQSSTGK